MIAFAGKSYRVSDLMDRNSISLDELVRATGIDADVVEAIADQRYTPSVDQRNRVSDVFGVRPEQIIWGHRTPVQPQIHASI